MNWKAWLRPVLVLCGAALALWIAALALDSVARENRIAEAAETMALLLPGSSGFAPEAYDGEDENIRAVYKGDTGYVIETVTDGYVDEVVLWVAVNNDGRVVGIVVRGLAETHGLGRRALSDRDFLAQFLGTYGEAAVGEEIDALTGATVTSKAVARGINSAAAFVTGADVSSSATEWGDW